MRSIISRKTLTAAAAAGVLSLTGGFALAANSHAGTGDSPGPGSAGHVQGPLPADVCGKDGELGELIAAAVGDLCVEAGEPGGYGDEPTHPPTTQPPTTHPPTTQPPTTHPPTTQPPTTHPPTTQPPTTHPPTTQPPTTHPPTTQPPTTHPPTTQPPTTTPPELPDTGGDSALMGAAAISAALIIGGTVVYLRGGRISRRH
ncbi:hypothetical protein [Streptomyces gardneri]|uniref:hypothetical protein n=1 Tax=Streptomyces gardneri TaxID=66892 RepID=UPI0037D817BB